MIFVFLNFFVFLSSFSLYAQKESYSISDYIRKYAAIAVEEMEKFGIPASIKLGQAILESSCGNSSLAIYANNHFGIKCGKEWKGKVIYYDDDVSQECFRKYDSPFHSFRDHSEFLQRSRYKKLFLFPKTDYKSWAKELKSAGYATIADYAERLIIQIEKYQLWRFDEEYSQGIENRIETHIAAIKFNNDLIENSKNNSDSNYFNCPITNNCTLKKHSYQDRILYNENGGLKYIIIKKGDSIESLSEIYGISVKRLAYYNDISQESPLLPGQYFFLERKNPSGVQDFYIVLQGETMYFISQKLGIQLEKLYYYNKINPFYEPKAGDILLLR